MIRESSIPKESDWSCAESENDRDVVRVCVRSVRDRATQAASSGKDK